MTELIQSGPSWASIVSNVLIFEPPILSNSVGAFTVDLRLDDGQKIIDTIFNVIVVNTAPTFSNTP